MRELLAPLRHKIFFWIWIATLVSNFGSMIQAVGAQWMMTSLTPSADMVALVQASTSLAVMMFSQFAGAVADVWDRRLVMLLAQTLMLVVSAALAVLAFMDLVTP
jgi:MFS family permease